MDTSVTKEQYLGLKVMRLLKPSLHSSLPFYKYNQSDSDVFENILFDKAFNSKETIAVRAQTNFALSDFLVLPQSFGNIFIGEVFSSYICIHNHTQFDVKQLSVKVELQTKSQKIMIPLQSTHGEYIEEFQHDQTFDALIHHSVKELGVHVLICSVNYTTEKDEKMNFKKFFKFIVSKPFEIQPKFPFYENPNYILFETQIQNVTNNILCMEKVTVEPNDGLIIEDLNQNSNPSFFDQSNFMKPTEIKQYLFRIRSNNGEPLLKPITIGKLDIIWRNPYSDIGRLQTNPLSQQDLTSLNKKEIDVRICEKPNLCNIGDSVELKLELKNISQRVLDLEVKLQNNEIHGFIWNCHLNYKLGKLLNNESKILNLKIVPTETGHLDIAGITITELFLKRTYDCSNLASFVAI